MKRFIYGAVMPKLANRPGSRYARDGVVLLGHLIRRSRIERKLTVEQLAVRAGLSRGLVQRIEKGDLGCSIGAVFEAAAVVNVPLFNADQAALTTTILNNKDVLTLLPKTVHTARKAVMDDF